MDPLRGIGECMAYTNREIAGLFEDMAALLEFKRDLIFKIRAYRQASQTIREISEPLEEMVQKGRDLKAIPGIGQAISKKIAELVTTGQVHAYEELKAQFPHEVLASLGREG